MDGMQFLGMVISSLITLGAFIAVIQKFTQPINDLRVVIQKLNDKIDNLTNDNQNQNRRLDKHSEKIDKLEHRVGRLETKHEMYNNKDN